MALSLSLTSLIAGEPSPTLGALIIDQCQFYARPIWRLLRGRTTRTRRSVRSVAAEGRSWPGPKSCCTAIAPSSLPKCLGSAAISRIVSANRRSGRWWYLKTQMIERTWRARDRAGRNLEIERRGVEVAMAEERLDDADPRYHFLTGGWQSTGAARGGIQAWDVPVISTIQDSRCINAYHDRAWLASGQYCRGSRWRPMIGPHWRHRPRDIQPQYDRLATLPVGERWNTP